MKVVQNGLRSILVSWASGGSTTTGYVIYIQQQNGEENNSITIEESDTMANITGLIQGSTYSLRLVATSDTLPSTVIAINVTIGQLQYCDRTDSFIIVSPQNKQTSLSPSLPHQLR